jgi:hypothetical protein
MHSSSIDLNAHLQRLGFTPDDLVANRTGSLTERQKLEVASRQRIYVRNGRFVTLIMWLVFVLLIVASQVVPLISGNKTMESFNHELPYIGLALLILSGIVGFALLWGVISGRDLTSGKISSVEGKARVRIRRLPGRYRDYPRCEVKISGRTFLLPDQNQFDAFMDGVDYRVFYVRYRPLHVILSAEVL